MAYQLKGWRFWQAERHKRLARCEVSALVINDDDDIQSDDDELPAWDDDVCMEDELFLDSVDFEVEAA